MTESARFVYRCPNCGVRAATPWQVLRLGPMSCFQCPQCKTRLGVSRLLASTAIVLSSLAFPLGAVATISMVGSFGGFGVLTLTFVAGGIAACLPIALWLLLSVKLVVR